MTGRIQLAINVDDLDESIAFYSKLFGAEPAKVRPGYANFAIADPPLKLILMENRGQGGSLNHLGVEVADTDAVDAEQRRLAGVGLASIGERDTTCCYARQNKFWVEARLRRYAAGLDAHIRTGTRVTAVEAHAETGFLVHTAAGETVHARGVVAATGSYGNPHVPDLPGQDGFTGRMLHVASYRNPHKHAGERIIVVGAGNSAVQVGYELSQVATVSLATRHPVIFVAQCRGARTCTTGSRPPVSTCSRQNGCATTSAAAPSTTPASTSTPWKPASSTGARCSPPSRATASSGRTEHASTSTPCCSPLATVPTWTT